MSSVVEVFQDITLADWCAGRGEPYHVVVPAGEQVALVVARPGFDQPQKFKYVKPEMFCGRVSEVRVLPPHGLVCAPGGRMIYRGFAHPTNEPQNELGAAFVAAPAPDVFHLAVGETAAVVNDECIYLGGNANFGHFVFEKLLRLSLVGCVPSLAGLPIAVYDNMPPRYFEFLDLMGFPARRRIVVPHAGAARFAKVWFLSSPVFSEKKAATVSIWSDALAIVRRTLGVDRPRPARRPRLFIGRSAAHWRRLANARAVEAILGRYGTAPVEFPSLSARQQIDAVADAELIVSVQGAAAAMTAFAPADCLVVELAAPRLQALFGPPTFAAALGRPIYRITGRDATAAEIAAEGLAPNQGKNYFDADFVVDTATVEGLMAILDRALGGRR